MLHELQRRMAAALLQGAVDDIAGEIVGGAPRLQIHRNNLFTALTDALAAHFPVVKRLVGDGFFAFAAHRFIAGHPPAGPCLAVYGDGFPEFLAGFAPARTLPYLADVARLEAAIIEARTAPPVDTIGIATAAAVAVEALARLRIRLNPGWRFVTSSFAIDAIWAANQPERDGTVALRDAGAVRFLEIAPRSGDGIAVTTLDEPVWRFRVALRDGRPLGAAAEASLALDPLFDLPLALHRLFEDGAVAGLSIVDQPQEGDA